MPKKSSSTKTPADMQEKRKPLVEDEKPSIKSKKSKNEIDEIFAGKKRKRLDGKKEKSLEKDKPVEPKSAKRMKEKKSKGAMKSDFADAPGRPRTKTQDGLSVYTEEELGINNTDAGNTPLCPFDCSCCF